jgi:hypothetical protein
MPKRQPLLFDLAPPAAVSLRYQEKLARSRERATRWRVQNPDRNKAYRKLYYAQNSERIRLAVKAWRLRQLQDPHLRQRYQAHERIHKQRRKTHYRVRILIQSARERAYAKRLPFDLDQHESELDARLRAGQCELTGLPLDFHANGSHAWNSPSADRIDPTKGYVLSNVRIICWALNAALSNWGEAIFRQVAEAYLARQGVTP